MTEIELAQVLKATMDSFLMSKIADEPAAGAPRHPGAVYPSDISMALTLVCRQVSEAAGKAMPHAFEVQCKIGLPSSVVSVAFFNKGRELATVGEIHEVLTH